MNIKHKLICIFEKALSVILPLKKQVIFESFHGKQYSDNPRAVSEKLHELDSTYRIVWIFRDTSKNRYDDIPDYVKVVKKWSLPYFINLVSSCAFVTNEAFDTNIYKREKQYFVQTWHGDRVFKKILYEAWENGNRPSPVMDEFLTDLCVAGSEKGVELYRDAFHYKGEILNVGCPRNDILININSQIIFKIKQNFGLKQSDRVLLYAPTYRDNINDMQKVQIDIEKVLDILESNGENWICMLRAHSNSKGLLYDNESTKIIDVTSYQDMADLLLVSDMLITDYSSAATDYIITERPVLLAAFDKDEYVKECRGFKYDISEPGFLIAKNQIELEELLASTQQQDYIEASRKVMKFYGVTEFGNASRAVSEKIIKHYESIIKKGKDSTIS